MTNFEHECESLNQIKIRKTQEKGEMARIQAHFDAYNDKQKLLKELRKEIDGKFQQNLDKQLYSNIGIFSGANQSRSKTLDA